MAYFKARGQTTRLRRQRSLCLRRFGHHGSTFCHFGGKAHALYGQWLQGVVVAHQGTAHRYAAQLVAGFYAAYPKGVAALLYFIRHTQRIGVEINIQARQWAFEQDLAREAVNFVVHKTGKRLNLEHSGKLVTVAGNDFYFFTVFNHGQLGQDEWARHTACSLLIDHLAAVVAAGKTGQATTTVLGFKMSLRTGQAACIQPKSTLVACRSCTSSQWRCLGVEVAIQHM